MQIAIAVVFTLILMNYMSEFVIEPRAMRKKIIRALEHSETSLSPYEIRQAIDKSMRFFGVSNNKFHIALRKLVDMRRVIIDDSDVPKYGIRYGLPADHVYSHK